MRIHTPNNSILLSTVFLIALSFAQGKNYDISGAMAKSFTATTAMRVTTEAVQIHGGYGYVRDYHVERMMRDAKITEIYEGTTEIQKIVISRGILKD